MKIAIGPCLFDWGKGGTRDFYRRMAFETEADILYIGEVVCSKRFHLVPEELAKLVDELQSSGKQIVLSTLGLIMSEGEQQELRELAQLARERSLLLETNDMAGIGVGEGQPLVAGPHINTYNPETLTFLQRVGVVRVVMPVELSGKAIAGIHQGRGAGKLETEVFAYGRLPLTFSARCYTARVFKLPKANCQYKCGDYPDGMVMKTQEKEEFLAINGIETMSDRVFNLVGEVDPMREMGVGIVRLSPQSQNMTEIVAVWKKRLSNTVDSKEAVASLTELNTLSPFCNGYFYGKPGSDFIAPAG